MYMQVGKRPTGSAIGRSPEPVANKTQRTTSEEWSKWLSEVSAFVGGRTIKQSDNRPFVDVALLGRSFRALVDTGAVVNLVSEKVARYIERHNPKVIDANLSLRMADGTTCHVVRGYRVEGFVNGKPHTWDAYSVPGLASDMILGIVCIRELSLLRFDPIEKPLLDSSDEGCLPVVDVVNHAATPLNETRLADFLDHELSLFSGVAGKTALVKHVIRLKDNVTPVKQRYYPRNPSMQTIIDEEVVPTTNDTTSPMEVDTPVAVPDEAGGSASPCLSIETSDVEETPADDFDRHESLLKKDEDALADPQPEARGRQKRRQSRHRRKTALRRVDQRIRPRPTGSGIPTPRLQVTLGVEGTTSRVASFGPVPERTPSWIPDSVVRRLEATYPRMTPAERRRKRWRIFKEDGTFTRMRPAALKRLLDQP